VNVRGRRFRWRVNSAVTALVCAVVSLAVLLAVMSCGSNGLSQTSPSAGSVPVSPSQSSRSLVSPLPTVPSDWKTITDSVYGYSFRYPDTWYNVTQSSGAPSGAHDVTSIEGLSRSYDLGATGWWFGTMVNPPSPSVGCSEDLYQQYVDKKTIQLDGQSATQILRRGWQAHSDSWLITVITRYAGNCYQFNLMAGSQESLDSSLLNIQLLEAGFRFSS
jgi:hypothetical protein